jgi:hypothetical protein
MGDFYLDCFDKHLDGRFDAELAAVNGLTWLPWVGKEYPESRILIIAESHYTNENDKESAEIEKQKIMAQPRYTRDVIAEYPVAGAEESGWRNHGGRSNNPTFDNLHHLLVSDSLNSDIPRRAVLWRNLGYMNIVQRPMWYSAGHKERPTGDDFVIGWRVVAEVIRILEPRLCIFAGLEAANSFDYQMTHLGIQHEAVKYGDAIGRCRPREASCSVNGNPTAFVFIRHPSRYFSWESWQKFVFAADRQQWQQQLSDRIFLIDHFIK